MTRIVAIALTILLALIALTSSAFAQATTATAFTVSLPMVVSAIAAPTVVPTPVSDACGAVNRAFEVEVLRLINVERAKVGLSALVEDKSLTVAARCFAIDLAANNYLSHTGLDGSTPHERMIDAGYTGTPWSEVAAGCWSSAQDVVDGWMGSSGHNGIMLSSDVTEFGAGYGNNPAGSGSLKCSWVVDFGKR